MSAARSASGPNGALMRFPNPGVSPAMIPTGYLVAARLARACGDRGSLWSSLAGVACRLAEVGARESAVLLGTWAARQAGWPDDWMTIPLMVSGEALVRDRDELGPSTARDVAAHHRGHR